MLSSAPKKQALEIQIEEEDEKRESNEQFTSQTAAAAEAISHQIGIIEEILSRVPVKTLLQFRCVSKPWLSLISDPSFIKRYNTRTSRHRGLFIAASDRSTSDKYILFAGHDGGAITHLLSFPDSGEFPKFGYLPQHVNGLLLYTPLGALDKNYFVFVVNPSTRKIFKVPGGAFDPRGTTRDLYFLGFDESSSEHKIVNIKAIEGTSRLQSRASECEFKLFSLSNYSWRKIDVGFPFDPFEVNWLSWDKRSVCLNNVVYFVIHDKRRIMGFDLQTEKFSVMDTPVDCRPFIMIVNGLLSVCGSKHIGNRTELDVWILKDYKNQIWVNDQTFGSPDSSIRMGVRRRSYDSTYSTKRLSPDVLSISLYNIEDKTSTSTEVNVVFLYIVRFLGKTLSFHFTGFWFESSWPFENCWGTFWAEQECCRLAMQTNESFYLFPVCFTCCSSLGY